MRKKVEEIIHELWKILESLGCCLFLLIEWPANFKSSYVMIVQLISRLFVWPSFGENLDMLINIFNREIRRRSFIGLRKKV